MIWWSAATLLAFFVKGLCGFANTLVFTTVLSFGHTNASISPVELLLGYPTNLLMVWRERSHIRWKICLPLAAVVTLGMLPGTFLLKTADAQLIKIFFGGIIVLLGLEMLLRPQSPQMKRSTALTAVIGLLSGMLCGLYGVGALMGAYMSRVAQDTSDFKANLCIVFLIENTVRIMLYAAWELFSVQLFRQVLLLAPLMLAGLFLGMLAARKLNEAIVRKTVIIALIVSGAALILNQL